ncbi:MAG TPA: TonB-dependent receptor [Gammaproteobacteria bacterium]|nr:TonB-dependent receptor [Gammaproteobacteria bacterium]
MNNPCSLTLLRLPPARRARTAAVAAAIGVATATTPAFAQSPEGKDQNVEEIVVLGSYIKRPTQADAPSPLIIMSAEDIAASGANKVSDVIQNLTINTGSQNNPDAFTQNQTTGTSNVNLRGLGVSSTLVLVNGRRQTQSAAATDRGENFVDTSALPPLIAFERVELLKDGATALYGSEAVAGVVNFLTRSSFDGFDLEAGLQAVDGTPQQDVEISGLYGAGTGDRRTHVLVAFDHLDRSMLSTADRRLSTTTDDLSQAGMPGSFLAPTRPTSPIYGPVWAAAYDSNNNGIADFVEPQLGLPAVPGAKPPVFADQSCTQIATQDKTVIPLIAANVATPVFTVPLGLCGFDFGSFYSLVPREKRDSAYFELGRQMNDGLQGRIELHFARNDAERDNSPSFPFAAFPVVPASHPDNPYGTNVQFIGRLIGAGGSAIETLHDSDTWRLAASLSGPLGHDWVFDLGTTYSENKFFVQAPDVLKDRLTNAIRGLGGAQCDPATGTPGVAPCQYYNPFGSSLFVPGAKNSPDLMSYLIGYESFDAQSDLFTVEGYVTRQLGDLRGGAIGVAVGAQYRSEKLSYDYDPNANRDNFMFLIGNPDFANDRNVEAAFVEFQLPFSETINVQAALRYENYGDGVSSTDPKLTLLWRPSLKLSVRASAGTSFRAPSLFQAFGTQTTLAQLIDPRVQSPQFFPVRTQPNPTGAPLQPESADVLNFGATYAPTDQLNLSLDYWSFDYSDVIVEQNPQALLNAAALGDPQARLQVIRDPVTGLLLRVDSYYQNASKLKTDGFDLSAAYTFALRGAGTLRVGTEGTYIESYNLDDPQAGHVDGAGKRNFANFGTSTPRWRANAFVNWRHQRNAVNVYVRYIDSYTDDEVQLGQGPSSYRPIGSFTTVDAQYTLTLGRKNSPTLSFGAINLFGEDPPHVATNGGYDSKVADPRGRVLYAKAAFKF